MPRFHPLLVIPGALCYAAAFMCDIFLATTFGFGISYLKVLGVGLLAAGIAISVAARVNLWRSYHFVPTAKKLVTTGLYRYFSHPMYVGNELFFLGLGTVTGSIWGVAVAFLVLLPLHMARARWEERVLRGRFGDEYGKYKKRVII